MPIADARVFLHADNGFDACYFAPNICENRPERLSLSADGQHGPGTGNFFLTTPIFERGGTLTLAAAGWGNFARKHVRLAPES